MNRTRSIRILVLVVLLVLSAGCASEPNAMDNRREVVVEVEKEGVRVAEVERAEAFATPTPAPAAERPASGEESGAGSAPPVALYRVGRMIIKNAEVRLLVEDTTTAVDRVTQVAVDSFGYLISSRTWYEDGFPFATLTIGVPSEEYENAMRRLRGIGIRVLDEHASGADVSDEYVDLDSRLRNLEATEVRIRSFLEVATTVEESLRVNQELSKITAQIEEVKGRMNYLKDRAAFSTITVHLEPQIPTPTPFPTHAPRPTPTPEVWRPDETFRSAGNVLGAIMRTLGDLAIWFSVVLGPFLLPAAIVLWVAVRRHVRRKRGG